jgi:hypothetical protein
MGRWLERLVGGYEGLGVLVVVLLAPLAAVYALVTGEPGQALIALVLFFAGLVYFARRLRARARRE